MVVTFFVTDLFLFLLRFPRPLSLRSRDQVPCGPTGTSFGNCQETGTRMVRAYRAPQQLLRNHPFKSALEVGRRRGRQGK